MKQKDKDTLFGSRVKAIRKRLKLLQTEFCHRLDISVTHLSEIENCKSRPGHDFFYQIVKEFNVNLNYLLFGEGMMFRTGEPAEGNGTFLNAHQLGYNVTNEDIEEFLDYFFNSKYFQYKIMAEYVRIIGEGEKVIQEELRRKKDRKKK